MFIDASQYILDGLCAFHEEWLKGKRDSPIKFDSLTFKNIDFTQKMLKKATFISCEFIDCKMYSAIFDNADVMLCAFRNVDMSMCSCAGTDFQRCSFDNVCFSKADLAGADFYMSEFYNVDFSNASTFCTHNFHSVCPEEGSFIGFKRCGDAIVKLQIPEDALRSSATSRKCRCSKAKVLEITDENGEKWEGNSVFSKYDPGFEYAVGKIVEVPDFDTDRWRVCSTGIHFFLTRQEAINYR